MTIPRWRLALSAGALIVLGAVGGGFVQAATGPAVAAPPANADSATATDATDADAAILLDTFALMSDPTSSGAAVPAQLLALRDRIQERIAHVRGHLVHGTLTLLDRDGKLVTYQLDHGKVTAVDSDSITIAEAGGATVTVARTSDTRIRKALRPSTPADLRTGDEVLVRSTVAGNTATANLVIILSATTTTAPPTGGNG
jgi:hypothetical protein